MEQERAKIDGGLGPEAPDGTVGSAAGGAFSAPPLSYWRMVARRQRSAALAEPR